MRIVVDSANSLRKLFELKGIFPGSCRVEKHGFSFTEFPDKRCFPNASAAVDDCHFSRRTLVRVL